MIRLLPFSPFFFFNDTATTEIYTLSLHDALPICPSNAHQIDVVVGPVLGGIVLSQWITDRKSTRLNSSHQIISYAVFCLKKKKKNRYKRYLHMSSACLESKA